MAGSMMARVASECECGGDISASQEDALACSAFLGGDGDHDESEVSAAPPDLPQQQEEEEDTVTMSMCTLPSTPTPSRSPSPAPPSPRRNRKPRVCVRKVRGAKIRTPTPSPDQPPEQQQQQPPEQQPNADPLYRAVLMVGTLAGASARSSNENALEDFLALARQRGLL